MGIQNFDNGMISNYSSSTANNDVAPPPYTTSYSTNSQKPIAQPHTSTGGSHLSYATAYGNSQAQHPMDTPSTSQLQRTINRTLLGGNESTMLSEQQTPPGF